MALIIEAIEGYDALLPPPPSDQDWEEALKDVGNDLKDVAAVLKDVIGTQSELHSNVSTARTMVGTGISHPTNAEQCESFITQCFDTINGFANVLTPARSYRDAFVAVEVAVGKEASTDANYRPQRAPNRMHRRRSVNWRRPLVGACEGVSTERIGAN